MLNTDVKKTCEQAFRRLAERRARLIDDFVAGRRDDFMRRHTRILDDYFRESFEQSLVGPTLGINRNPYAIIALGGYGRAEQCLHSDVDVLFLFKKKIPEEAEGLIREMIYPLWDMGLDIGHATRSLSECLALAGRDFEVLTSLLDARFICGMSPLYSELTERLRDKILSKRANKIIAWLMDGSRERHRYFGDSAYLLEPNLKEGQGGLRDYHTIGWIGRVKLNLQRPRDLEFQGVVSHAEYVELTEALEFVWNVRGALHYLVGRKYDHLHFEYQTRLAEMLGYVDQNGQSAVERFLGDLHSRMERIKQRLLMFLFEVGAGRKWLQIRRRSDRRTDVAGLTIHKDRLRFVSPEEMIGRPVLLMKIFEESARLKIPLAAEAKRLVREFPYLIDDSFRAAPEVVRSFDRILSTRSSTFNVLNEMLSTGLLTRFIPELSAIVDRIEYDAYHVYPVDKHSLRTVRTLKTFGATSDPADRLYADLYKELAGRRRPLLWAALLHDIGKGVPGGDHADRGAEMVPAILARAGMRPEEIETVTFLVREHLFLIKTATRRDVTDEETAVSCARRVADPERLKMLYLLTVADFMSTGPKAWNEWTAILLRDLFLKVIKVIERGELASDSARKTVRRKEAELLDEAGGPSDRNKREALLRVMSPRYLLYIPTDEIRDHLSLYDQLEGRPFVWRIERIPSVDGRRITVLGRRAPGFFATVAGVLTVNGIDILEAQVYTWQNGVGLYRFQVGPPPDPIFEADRWERAEANLRDALAGKLDLNARVTEARRTPTTTPGRRPNRVKVDNAASSFYTVVEVFSHDVPGLLYRIADALHRLGLEIRGAQIATKVDQVVDVFYVRDFDGRKVESRAGADQIRRAVMAVLPEAEG